MRGLPAYEYARDKTEIDRLCQLWAAQHPDRTMTIVRPTIVFGPERRQLHRPLLGRTSPFVALLDGHDPDWQFVHEDDVVDAMSRLLSERRGGIFNLTADGTIKLSEAAAIAGLKMRKMPLKLYRRIAAASWKLRLPQRRGAARARSSSCCIPGSPRTRSSRRARLDAALHEPRDVRDHDAREGARPTGPRRQRGRVRSGASGGYAGRVVQRLNSDACRAHSSVGRAPARQAGGHWFEPSCAHPLMAVWEAG